MSTYWGYRCQTHTPALESDHWFNHGEERLKGLLKNRKTLRKVLPYLYDYEVEPDFVDWLMQHIDCDVVVANEYGETLEEYRKEK